MFELNEDRATGSHSGEAPLMAWVAPEIKVALGRVLSSLEPVGSPLELSEAEGDDTPRIDTAPAIHELHTVMGVLHMVGEGGAALYVQCLKDVLARSQQAGRALAEAEVLLLSNAVNALQNYVAEGIRGERVSPVVLFPSYVGLQHGLGHGFVHPADLWIPEVTWRVVVPPANTHALQPDASVRVLFERFLLLVLQGKDAQAASKLALLCAGLAKGAPSSEHCTFWMAVAAVSEGLHHGLIALDVYVKRTLSGVLQRYLDLSGGQAGSAQHLLRQLLFFCAQAIPHESHLALCMRSIRNVYQLQLHPSVNWQSAMQAQVSPEQREAVRQAVKSVKAAWVAYTEGAGPEATGLASCLSRLEQVMAPLPGQPGVLMQRVMALVGLVEPGKVSAIPMEIATLLLYLEASATVPGEMEVHWATRLPVFSTRFQALFRGAKVGPMPDWVERLCRSETEFNPLASVARELKLSMSQVERGLESLFAGNTQQEGFDQALTSLAQMRGVFGLLAQPAAVRAVEHVHQALSQWSRQPIHADMSLVVHTNISTNIGGLTLLIEELEQTGAGIEGGTWIFDEVHRFLRLRHLSTPAHNPQPSSIRDVGVPAAAAQTTRMESSRPALEIPLGVRKPIAQSTSVPLSTPSENPDPEIVGIFKEEAQELLAVAQELFDLMSGRPSDIEGLADLRRVFHTLKGSARMASLTNVGEIAWNVEQQLNRLLAQQEAVHADTLKDLRVAWRDIVAIIESIPTLDHLSVAVAESPQPIEVPTQEIDAPSDLPVPTLESEPAPDPVPNRRVGPVELSSHLFEVFIAESDVVSQRLQLAVERWAEGSEALDNDAESCAHTLAGAAGAVGFDELAECGRRLESVCRQIAAAQWSSRFLPSAITSSLCSSARDIRTVLHFFAAGMYKRPQVEALAGLLEQLQAIRKPVAQASASINPTAASSIAPVQAVVQAHSPVQTLDGELHNQPDADLFPVFEAEASELMPRLLAALRHWVAHPHNRSAAAEMQRLLHTLKGSARLAGALRWADQVHTLESQVQAMAMNATADDLRWLQGETDALLETWQELCSVPASFIASTVQPEPPALSESIPVIAPVSPSERQGAPDGLVWPQHPTAPGARQARTTLRVATDVLDRLVNEAGEIMIGRTRVQGSLAAARGSLTELSANLERLRLQLRDMELQTETQMQSRLALARDTQQAFDPLEFDRFTRVQEITRSMAESVNDVATVQRQLQRALDGADDQLDAQGRQSRALQRDLLGTRLVEFEAMAERLYRVVRQAAKETGKQVRLDIVGGAIDMDRGMLERLTPAFEHLLRNAVVHGVEAPEVRQAAGKAPEGRIAIELTQLGNDVRMVVSDDGAGLDVTALGARAQALGLSVPQADDTEAWAELVFVPGLSTAASLSALAGRGVGMDVVRSDIVSLGGRVQVHHTPTAGCRIEMVLPLTTAITQVVTMRVGDHVFGVPATLVETVRRFDAATLQQAYAAGHLPEAGEAAPLFWAGALLQQNPGPQQWLARGNTCVWLRSAGQRVALHVDEVMGSQEVVVKKLGPQLSGVPGLAGMSVLGSGAVALIHNPVVLARLHGDRARAYARSALPEATPEPLAAPLSRQPLVLVVDDSITVRRVTQRLLVREGYRVALAADGLQALELLPRETPTAVLCDIEMPRMDGFDLLRNLRGDARWAGVPVIMITSRIADKHRELALSLGANHYLGKPYPEDELLDLLRGFSSDGFE